MSTDKYISIDSHLIAASQLLGEIENDNTLPRYKRAEAMEFRARILGMRSSIWPQTQEEPQGCEPPQFGIEDEGGDIA